MEDVDEGGKILHFSVVDEEVSLELTANRKRRKVVTGLEAQVDIMTLDKANFANTDM